MKLSGPFASSCVAILTLAGLTIGTACTGRVDLGGPAEGSEAGTVPPALDAALPPSVAVNGDAGLATPPTYEDSGIVVSPPELDAALDASFAAQSGLAGFAFVINDVTQQPMACPSDDWEFAPFPTSADSACNPTPPGCPGVTRVSLVNTGQVPVAYYATNAWEIGAEYVPGVATGAPFELAGVLNPGTNVDITSVFSGGISALLGSAEPFSASDAGKYESDEGTIPWPAGVPGSGGATQMSIAEIEVQPSCTIATKVW